MHIWRFEAIGTHWEVETSAPLSPQLAAGVSTLIAEFDATWSRFRDDSSVSALRGGGSIPVPPDADAMLSAYRVLSAATDGAVTPLVGASLEALGYDAALTLQPREPIPAPARWDRTLRWDESALTLSAPAVIDVGALGKGRLVDLVGQALAGIPGRVTVDASGDLRVRGGTSRIALEHPYDATRAIGVVEVTDAALCASATTRRAWSGGLHHVVDGRTGLPVREWAATWAIAPDAMMADALATALFFTGGPALAARWGGHWVRMGTDGRVERSAGFDGELFLPAAEEEETE